MLLFLITQVKSGLILEALSEIYIPVSEGIANQLSELYSSGPHSSKTAHVEWTPYASLWNFSADLN